MSSVLNRQKSSIDQREMHSQFNEGIVFRVHERAVLGKVKTALHKKQRLYFTSLIHANRA